MIKVLSDYLFYSDEYCKVCLNEKSESNICSTCIERLEFISSKRELELGVCYYPLFYNNFMREIIRKFKYEKATYLAKPLVEILYKFYKSLKLEFDYVTYVPMYANDEYERGYNQSYYLAEKFSKLSGIKLISIVNKVKKTKHQNKIDRNERVKNLSDSFKTIKGMDINGSKVLIIDDLVTTGSTLNIISNVINDIYNLELTFMAITSSKVEGE